jgi:hypothetical protein
MPTVHGYFTSADASALTEANARILLYPGGSSTALTVGTTDYVLVTGINILTAGALTVTVYDGADATPAAGEIIAKVTVNGNLCIPLETPYICQKGTWPKVLTSASGQTDVTIRGSVTGVAPH